MKKSNDKKDKKNIFCDRNFILVAILFISIDVYLVWDFYSFLESIYPSDFDI